MAQLQNAINGDNLVMVAVFDLELDLRLVERMTMLGKLFFAISRLSDCHMAALTATLVILF
jgi:hypothetical protein